jgi:hypothetical protein
MSKETKEVKHNRGIDSHTQVKFWISPEIAAAFKSACRADGVSMAREVSNFMATRSGRVASPVRRKEGLLLSRGGRRKLLNELIQELERIRDAEEQYRDRIPENLQGSVRYDNAEDSLLALEEALDTLNAVY